MNDRKKNNINELFDIMLTIIGRCETVQDVRNAFQSIRARADNLHGDGFNMFLDTLVMVFDACETMHDVQKTVLKMRLYALGVDVVTI